MQVLKLLQALLPSVPAVCEVVRQGEPLAALEASASQPHNRERAAFLRDNAELVGDLGKFFLPLLHQIYSVHSTRTVKTHVRLTL